MSTRVIGNTKWNWKRYAGLVAVLLIFLVGVGVAVSSHGRPDKPSTHGKLVFSDDFERSNIGEKYVTGQADQGYKAGRWIIKDGQLRAEKIHNAALWLQTPLPEKVRIEFMARAHTDTGDIKCEVFGDGRTHQSGYIAIFGGWNNTVRAIARLDEHGEDRKNDNRCRVRGGRRRCVEKGVDYKWTIERTDHIVKWYIDDQLLMTYPDQNPLNGRHFAFNNWQALVTFDTLRIYDLSQ